MLDVKERLRHLDELELDVQVLYPTIFLRQLTRKPEVEIALCKSYNRWLAELCQRGEGRVKWVATLPLMSMDAAVKEATFAKQHGACGLFTRGLVNNRLFNDPYFYPFFEEASRLDLPICIHASAGSFEWMQLFDREGGFAQFKVPVLSSFHTIVYDGIPEKFPNYGSVLSKSGRNGSPICSWIWRNVSRRSVENQWSLTSCPNSDFMWLARPTTIFPLF